MWSVIADAGIKPGRAGRLRTATLGRPLQCRSSPPPPRAVVASVDRAVSGNVVGEWMETWSRRFHCRCRSRRLALDVGDRDHRVATRGRRARRRDHQPLPDRGDGRKRGHRVATTWSATTSRSSAAGSSLFTPPPLRGRRPARAEFDTRSVPAPSSTVPPVATALTTTRDRGSNSGDHRNDCYGRPEENGSRLHALDCQVAPGWPGRPAGRAVRGRSGQPTPTPARRPSLPGHNGREIAAWRSRTAACARRVSAASPRSHRARACPAASSPRRSTPGCGRPPGAATTSTATTSPSSRHRVVGRRGRGHLTPTRPRPTHHTPEPHLADR